MPYVVLSLSSMQAPILCEIYLKNFFTFFLHIYLKWVFIGGKQLLQVETQVFEFCSTLTVVVKGVVEYNMNKWLQDLPFPLQL